MAGALLAALLLNAAGCFEQPAAIGPTEITNAKHDYSVTIQAVNPGDEGALFVRTDHATIDLKNGRVLGAGQETPPDRLIGRGIVVKGARSATIRNARLRGFKVGIYAEDAPGLTIENCDVSDNYRQRLQSTPAKEDESDWLYGHENDHDEWLRYGAGIYLKNCPGATIRNCRARDGQNGICLVRCDGAAVVGNDLSFMSGWGLALWRSSRGKIIGNRLDYCVRGYSHGVYARGQDSAGILVYEQCSDNVFAYNHATHGGDGFFLYAGNETVKKTGEGGCNRNIVYDNDFSHAVANGIEATFSDRNVFMNNRLDGCEHGVWAGYSSNALIENNHLADCVNGVSIEHGRRNRIFWNRFTRCRRGLHVWWDDDRDLLESPYAKRQGAQSADEYAERNCFVQCDTAILADGTKGVTVNGNAFQRCRCAVRVTRPTTGSRMIGNVLEEGFVQDEAREPIGGFMNYLAPAVQTFGVCGLGRPAKDAPAAWRAIHNGPDDVDRRCDGEPDAWRRVTRVAGSPLPAVTEEPPDRIGEAPLGPLPGVPEGKEHLVIDEWGPVDPTRPRPSVTPPRANPSSWPAGR